MEYQNCRGVRIAVPQSYGDALRLIASDFFGHGVSVIVNGSAVIGNNVNLSHFVTIGSLKGTAAVIEDGACIGPSTSLVDDVRIGSNAMVGAGAVVVRDVPAGAVAAGVPARIINENGGYKPVNPVSLCGCL